MIGVIANASEHAIVREFFELFKTPWEFYWNDREYEVVLCTGSADIPPNASKIVLIYLGQALSTDTAEVIESALDKSKRSLVYRGMRIPIYGKSIAFREGGTGVLVGEATGKAAMRRRETGSGAVIWVGYDLFAEVRALLADGQPVAEAAIPTLELHISLLRELILAEGVQLVEIPPVPNGYRFIACLTHDVDHPSIANHIWDHTIFGFLYRAVLGSTLDLFRSRISFRQLFGNWAAALRLPFVYMGLANDFWGGFADRYLGVEKGVPSTYFVIPFRDDPGTVSARPAAKRRAARYCAKEIADTIQKIIAAGCEVGLHGIDAWLDSARGVAEIEEIARLTGTKGLGVRTHWLYYDEQSPAVLEHAGARYDSTVGYSETVGYRSGTTQAYKPANASRLLELPMHVMDTALFYPAYLNLSQRQAAPLLERIVDDAMKFGGCITINWHDRSLAPERGWESCYRKLLENLKRRGAWFATCGQAISWFQMRRAAVFENEEADTNHVRAKVMVEGCDKLPGLRLRVYNRREPTESWKCELEDFVDFALPHCIQSPTPTTWVDGCFPSNSN
ncbi:MAG: hypothetical protein WB341_08555 [Terracidiphilus sp.]